MIHEPNTAISTVPPQIPVRRRSSRVLCCNCETHTSHSSASSSRPNRASPRYLFRTSLALLWRRSQTRRVLDELHKGVTLTDRRRRSKLESNHRAQSFDLLDESALHHSVGCCGFPHTYGNDQCTSVFVTRAS